MIRICVDEEGGDGSFACLGDAPVLLVSWAVSLYVLKLINSKQSKLNLRATSPSHAYREGHTRLFLFLPWGLKTKDYNV